MYVSVGRNLPLNYNTSTPSNLEWANAMRSQTAADEEWYFNFNPYPQRYIFISSGGYGMDLRKIAVFGVDYCSSATSVSVTLLTTYAPISYALGSTITIPWPSYNVSPADCFIPVNFIFKNSLAVVLAPEIITVDWVLKTLTYVSSTCHSPYITI